MGFNAFTVLEILEKREKEREWEKAIFFLRLFLLVVLAKQYFLGYCLTIVYMCVGMQESMSDYGGGCVRKETMQFC